MKRFVLKLFLPSAVSVHRWERTSKRGFVRFMVLTGATWLVLFVTFGVLLEILRPGGFISDLTESLSHRPITTTAVLLGTSLGFGALMYVALNVLYKIARTRIEP
jgi:hypothetical protein